MAGLLTANRWHPQYCKRCYCDLIKKHPFGCFGRAVFADAAGLINELIRYHHPKKAASPLTLAD